MNSGIVTDLSVAAAQDAVAAIRRKAQLGTGSMERSVIALLTLAMLAAKYQSLRQQLAAKLGPEPTRAIDDLVSALAVAESRSFEAIWKDIAAERWTANG